MFVTLFLVDHFDTSETITFKLEWTSSKKTLADIQSLLKKTFKSLTNHIHMVVVGGSVTVICYAPPPPPST